MRPRELVLARWWLARVHERCASAPVRPWAELPEWAVEGQSCAVGPGAGPAGADGPESLVVWETSVAPDGLPMLSWRPAAPVGQVVLSPGRWGGGDERLVDVLSETMQARGAQELTGRDLVPDGMSQVPALGGWYGQMSEAGDLTVWMPSSWQYPDRALLCTLHGVDPGWAEAVRAAGRILLAMRPPGIKRPVVSEALLHLWRVMDEENAFIGGIDADQPAPQPRPLDPVGGIVRVGAVPDEHRAQVVAARRRVPAVAVRPPIDVGALWDTAWARAGYLVDAAQAGPPESHLVPVDGSDLLIALVLTALCRDQDRLPDEVDLADVGLRLTSPGLASWLEVMLAPTSAADDLRRAAVMTVSSEGWDDSGSARLLYEPSRVTALVGRQWLIDGGGLRLGDRAWWLPPAEDAGDLEEVPARECRVVGLSTATFPVHSGATWINAQFHVAGAPDAPHRFDAHGYDLLCAENDPGRALVQSAYSAGCDLWFARHGLDRGQYTPGQVWRRLRGRARYHTAPEVRSVFDTVLDTDDAHLAAALTSGIVQLQALAPQQPIPGTPIGGADFSW
ncbi:hypothetical protein [Actinoplanes derwentensis]|uniref:hypothetical protein n=1 Tax=Actinoplanes derwentensis TaxID=113562 RepID=UPI0012FE3A1A|nr:hypothetical protein [Actinoplanes derwentensis]GID82068.1 hypothetical protein Ade03nite_09920 [Actinoplanes derwentensis]